ncbi:apolipophorin-III-like protein [Lasioglossum baleicum]|uniref:apolipophorin-III-like protein n=1 Tax=Lasioglossum baleicum TaxID=434251 RepID=UPI003FCD546E
MKSILAIALALAVVVATEAKAVDTTPSNTDTQTSVVNQLTVLITEAQANINDFAKQIQEKLNLPDQETLVKNVKEQTNDFANNFDAYLKNVTAQVQSKSPELEAVWNDVKGKIAKGLEVITSGNTNQQLADLEAKFKQGVQVVLTESDNTAKNLSQHSTKIQEEIAKFTKQAVDLTVEATQNLNNVLQQAAATPKKD